MRIGITALLASGVFGFLMALTPAAAADKTFPNHPLRLIVPFAPGGGADANARRIAEPWSKALGQPIIVDNRPGAGGTVGANYVAHSPADGYTLLYTTPGQQMTAPYLFKSLAYDPMRDLVPVGRVTEGANVLIVNNKLPVHSVAELIAYAKAHPNKLGFASSGIGSTSHLAGELFKQSAGIDIFHVPYRGTGPALNDLMGGQVPMTIDTLSVYLSSIQAGAVRALGVSTLKRNETLPDLPAIAETLPGFESIPINYVTVPAGTPAEIIQTLNASLNRALADTKLRKELIDQGTAMVGSTPQEMERIIKSEQEKWRDLIKRADIKIDE